MIGKKFVKVYGQFFTGRFRSQRPTVKVVFLTLLWLADEQGVVEATPSTLAFMSGIKDDACLQALSELEKPDPESSSPLSEGRRIVKLGPNRILVVNYEKYLRAKSAESGVTDSRREYMREYMQARRDAGRTAETSAEVYKQVQNDDCKHPVNVNTTKKKRKEEIGDTPPTPSKRGKRRLKALELGKPEYADLWADFEAAYPKPSNGRSLRKSEARIVFDALLDSGEDAAEILAGVKRYARSIEATRRHLYVQAMLPWLNQSGWREAYQVAPDEPTVQEAMKQAEAAAKAEEDNARQQLDREYETFVNERTVALFDSGELEDCESRFAAWIADLKVRRSRISANAAAIIDRALEGPGRAGYVELFVKAEYPASVPPFEEWRRGR